MGFCISDLTVYVAGFWKLLEIYTYTTTLRVKRWLGEGREDPKRVRITKGKTMQKTNY
jgi:hypothetical protein